MLCLELTYGLSSSVIILSLKEMFVCGETEWE